MAQISITRALSEIKMLDKRIQEKTAQANFVALTRGHNERETVIGTNNTKDFVEKKIKGDYQSLVDLIHRRRVLKSLVAASNASTSVQLCGALYLVQDAIEHKNSIAYELAVHKRMTEQFRASITERERQNTSLNQKIETAVQQAYGNDKGKVTEEQYAAVAKPRLEEGEYGLCDPLNLEQLISDQADRLNEFLTEVDFVLSESNARVTIEVPDDAAV